MIKKILLILFVTLFLSYPVFSCDGDECWNDDNFEDSMNDNPTEAMNRDPQKVMELNPSLAMETDSEAATKANPKIALETNPNEAVKIINQDVSLLNEPGVIDELETQMQSSISIVNENHQVLTAYFSQKGIVANEGVQLRSFRKDGTVSTDGPRGSRFNINEIMNLGAEILSDGFLLFGDSEVQGDITIIDVEGDGSSGKVISTTNGVINVGESNDEGYAFRVENGGVIVVNGNEIKSESSFTVTQVDDYKYQVNGDDLIDVRGESGEGFRFKSNGGVMVSFNSNDEIISREFIVGGLYTEYSADDGDGTDFMSISMLERTTLLSEGSCADITHSCVSYDNGEFDVTTIGNNKIGVEFYDYSPKSFHVNEMGENNLVDIFMFETVDGERKKTGRVQFDPEAGIKSQPLDGGVLKEAGTIISMDKKDGGGVLKTITLEQISQTVNSGSINPNNNRLYETIEVAHGKDSEGNPLYENLQIRTDDNGKEYVIISKGDNEYKYWVITDNDGNKLLEYDSPNGGTFKLNGENINGGFSTVIGDFNPEEQAIDNDALLYSFTDYEYQFDSIASLGLNGINPNIRTNFDNSVEIILEDGPPEYVQIQTDNEGNEFVELGPNKVKYSVEYDEDGNQMLVYKNSDGSLEYYNLDGSVIKYVDENGNEIDGKDSTVIGKQRTNPEVTSNPTSVADSTSTSNPDNYDGDTITLTLRNGKEDIIPILEKNGKLYVQQRNSNGNLLEYELRYNDNEEPVLVWVNPDGSEEFYSIDGGKELTSLNGEVIDDEYSSVVGIRKLGTIPIVSSYTLLEVPVTPYSPIAPDNYVRPINLKILSEGYSSVSNKNLRDTIQRLNEHGFYNNNGEFVSNFDHIVSRVEEVNSRGEVELPLEFVLGIIAQESKGYPTAFFDDKRGVSDMDYVPGTHPTHDGARGLFQIRTPAMKDVSIDYGGTLPLYNDEDMWDSQKNIDIGVAYLEKIMTRYVRSGNLYSVAKRYHSVSDSYAVNVNNFMIAYQSALESQTAQPVVVAQNE